MFKRSKHLFAKCVQIFNESTKSSITKLYQFQRVGFVIICNFALLVTAYFILIWTIAGVAITLEYLQDKSQYIQYTALNALTDDIVKILGETWVISLGLITGLSAVEGIRKLADKSNAQSED